MTLRYKAVTLTAILVAASCAVAHADPISVEASDNATVQPGGPRSGTSGKAFLNIEGSANGSFASYGVADFDFGSLPFPVIGINAIQLDLVQANASFTTDGGVVFSIDQSGTLADIQPGGSSPLAFDGADPGTATDEGDGDLSLLSLGGGPFAFVEVATGNVDTYSFTLDAAAETEILARLNAGDPIRIVIGTGDASVAATWAGHSNFDWAGPTLRLDVEFDESVQATAQSWGRVKSIYR